MAGMTFSWMDVAVLNSSWSSLDNKDGSIFKFENSVTRGSVDIYFSTLCAQCSIECKDLSYSYQNSLYYDDV